MAQITAIRSMIRKDMSQFLHNKAFVITGIVTIFFNLLFPQLFSFQVRDVKIAAVVHDNSELSNTILKDIEYANDFVLTAQCATYDEALSLVKSDNADCIIEIPENFERDFLRSSIGTNKTMPRIQVSANAIITTKVLAASQGIAGSIATSLSSYAKNKGVIVKRNDSFITAQNLYNPSSDYKLLMLPVVFLGIIFVFSTSTRLITNELQYGTIDQINVSPMSRLSFMTSKVVTGYVISMMSIIPSMTLLWLVYSFRPQGSILLILSALSLYVICCINVALTICNLLSNASQMVLFTSVFALIAMMMSGFMTPLECIAEWLQPISYIMPTRYVITILRSVALKGSELTDLATCFIPLSILTVATFCCAVVTLKKSRE